MRSTIFRDTRAFYAIIFGQLVSTVGSGMTRFGLGIWVFSETGDTSAYTTLLFFAVLPLGLGSLVAGPLVDRFSRKQVMLIANTVASLSTLVVAVLFFANVLELWHLYVALFINGVANAFILPALDSSIALMVPKDQLGRASGLTQLVQALEIVLAPAAAGFLVGMVGLGAIFIVDFVTFGASILALALSAVPNPQRSEEGMNLWAEFAFGVRYIRERPAFLYLMGFVTLTMFLLPGIGYALVTPLVLTFSTEQAAGLVVSGFGVGSFIGGIALTAWGGPQRRMNGMLAAMGIAGFGTVLVGLRESELLMAFGFVIVGACFIFMVGLNRVIWQVKAAPDVLGRIFSLRVALGVGAQSLGILIAGPLAEYVFEPLMAQDGALSGTIGMLVGVGDGRGMALMFVLLGLALAAAAVLSATSPSVRLLEDRVPDYVEPRQSPAVVSG
ncbi:MAG: MFS transporter [Chloroflexota bacterium]